MGLSPPPQCVAMIENIFAAVDSQASKDFLAYLAEDATFRFGNWPVAAGHAAIADVFDSFCKTIRSLHHESVETFVQGNAAIIEQVVHYVDGWGRPHSLPCVNVLRFRDGKVADYRIFMDAGPLFSAPAS